MPHDRGNGRTTRFGDGAGDRVRHARELGVGECSIAFPDRYLIRDRRRERAQGLAERLRSWFGEQRGSLPRPHRGVATRCFHQSVSPCSVLVECATKLSPERSDVRAAHDPDVIAGDLGECHGAAEERSPSEIRLVGARMSRSGTLASNQ